MNVHHLRVQSKKEIKRFCYLQPEQHSHFPLPFQEDGWVLAKRGKFRRTEWKLIQFRLVRQSFELAKSREKWIAPMTRPRRKHSPTLYLGCKIWGYGTRKKIRKQENRWLIVRFPDSGMTGNRFKWKWENMLTTENVSRQERKLRIFE